MVTDRLFPVFYRKITCFLCVFVFKTYDNIKVSKEKATKEKELSYGQKRKGNEPV